jgi:hypothetical protein
MPWITAMFQGFPCSFPVNRNFSLLEKELCKPVMAAWNRRKARHYCLIAGIGQTERI